MTPPARCCASSARGKPPGRRPICCVPGSNATACREPYTPTGRTCMCACPTCRSGCGEKPRSPSSDRCAPSYYDDANAYLQEHYIAQHNRHYARPAAAEADYHRQRPTARQLDDVFWLEEERVLSEDWVVRLQKPPAATRAAKSSLGAGSEPSAGAGERARTHRHSLSRTELAVSRNSLGFFYGEEQGKGRCPFPCNPVPETYGCGRQASSLSCRQSSLETRLAEYENSCLLSRMVTRGHFYCGQTGDIPNVV